MALDFYDFYSGCGGTSRGMLDAGMTVRFGLDIDPDAKTTYEANFKEAKFIDKDIRQVSPDRYCSIRRAERRAPSPFRGVRTMSAVFKAESDKER